MQIHEPIVTNQLEDADDFPAVPVDDYLCQVVETDYRKNKAGNGYFIELKFEIIQGKATGVAHKGRRLIDIFNTSNPSQQAVEISRKKIKPVLQANGVASLVDTDQLLGARVVCKTKMGEWDGEEQAKVKSIRLPQAGPAGNVAPQVATPAPAPAQPSAPPAPAPAVAPSPAPAAQPAPWGAQEAANPAQPQVQPPTRTSPVANADLQDDIPF